jgi:hypothetical protein
MQEVSRHINKNSAKFKHIFMEDADDNKLKIVANISNSESFDDGIKQIVEMIHEKVKDKSLSTLCTKPFTTTTPLIQTCYSSILMNSMQTYHSYGMSTMCGIKHVKLDGKLSDWMDLSQRIKTLKTMPYAEGIEGNLDMMIIRIRAIIDSYRGDVNINFWNSIIHMVACGSEATLCSGWITDFFIYDSHNHKIASSINIKNIPLGYSGTPFELNGQNMILYSGQSGVQILPDQSITPSFVNVIAIKK